MDAPDVPLNPEWWTDMRQLEALSDGLRDDLPAGEQDSYYPPDRNGGTGYYPRTGEARWALPLTVGVTLLCVLVAVLVIVGAMRGIK